MQELLQERGIEVSHDTLREWNIKFSPLITEGPLHQEPCRGSRWHLDEVCTTVGGVRHWLWRAVTAQGFAAYLLGDWILRTVRPSSKPRSVVQAPLGGALLLALLLQVPVLGGLVTFAALLLGLGAL